jgi:hypothetical protein
MLAGWLIILPTGAARALQVGDVAKDPVARVAGSKLVLNGAGLRHRFKFDIYVIGLYLPQLQSSAQAAIGAEGPKRVALTRHCEEARRADEATPYTMTEIASWRLVSIRASSCSTISATRNDGIKRSKHENPLG